MISYFNAAGDKEFKLNCLDRPGHAKVSIIADKYVCEGLYELAKCCLGRTVSASTVEDWISAANLVYEFTTPESSVHRGLRSSLIKPLARDRHLLASVLKETSMQELLHSKVEIATDLLSANCEGWSGTLRVCMGCSFAHIGSDECSTFDEGGKIRCPSCYGEADLSEDISMEEPKPCPCCEGTTNEN